jgi:hypothetical protein
MVQKKNRTTNRSSFERLAIPFAILNKIPADGSCIRFSELDDFRKEKRIGLGTLNKNLKDFEERGLILKEAVKLAHGAGTCYRRTIPIPKLDKLGWEAFIRQSKGRIKLTKNPDEKERIETLYLTRALENYMTVIFRTLKAANKMNPDAAEAFVDAAGKSYITGLLKDIDSLQIAGSQALEVAEKAFGHPSFQLKKAHKAVHEKNRNIEKTDEGQEEHIKETFGFD